MAHPFVHVELNTTDVDRAKSFYTSLFGWTLKDEDMGGGMTYTMINVGEGTGGGMMKHPDAGRTLDVAALRAGGRHSCGYRQGAKSRGHGDPRRHGGYGRRIALDPQRSDRGNPGAVAAEAGLGP